MASGHIAFELAAELCIMVGARASKAPYLTAALKQREWDREDPEAQGALPGTL